MLATINHRPGETAKPTLSDRGAMMAALLVDGSVRRPRLTIVVALLVAALGAYVTATRFAITTQTDQLIEGTSAWRQDRTAYREAFPQLAEPILIVIDAKTPEQASEAASRLTAALGRGAGSGVERAWQPDGGAFLDQNGLLLLPQDELKSRLETIEKQAPALSALGGDPSLRGLARLVQLGAGQGALAEQGTFLDRLSGTIEQVLKGEPARFSWSSLVAGEGDDQRLRRFVLVDPVLDYKALQPAAGASAAIRKAAADLKLTPEAGVRVRLTGAAPLADEEFATVEEGAPLHLGLTVVAIAVILFAALRSGSLIAAVLITTFAGLAVTLGAGLLMVGRFNVISVAVAALFLGLGVDFGIQFAVRYRDERHRHDNALEAVRRAARGVGWSLTLAAASLLVGFFSFLPTSFKGVSELGLITGVGMVFAYLASLTLLPALITVLSPPGEPESVETAELAAVDHWILRHRWLIIGVSALLVVAGLPFLLRLEFDANPMHLRSDRTEAVATFLDLTHTPGMTPNTISVLAPSRADAATIAARLRALPEVSGVTSLATFLPEGQDAKIAVIQEAAGRMPGLMQAQPPAPAPSDADVVQALQSSASALDRLSDAPAKRLAQSFRGLAQASPNVRMAAAAALTGGLPDLIGGVRRLLAPQPLTLERLPATLRDDWLAKGGRARIEVTPKGDANDNDVIDRFVAAVQRVAPNSAGAPVDIVASRQIIVQAFMIAAGVAFVGVFVILTVALRHPGDVLRTLGPLVVAMILTLEAADLIGMPLNLANVIALPLMLAVGVNFHIYYLVAWRNGMSDPLASSLTRAIFFSSLTTGVAFGSLWLSNHPGTASMGKLLTLSLVFTLAAAFIIVPAVLGAPEVKGEPQH